MIYQKLYINVVQVWVYESNEYIILYTYECNLILHNICGLAGVDGNRGSRMAFTLSEFRVQANLLVVLLSMEAKSSRVSAKSPSSIRPRRRTSADERAFRLPTPCSRTCGPRLGYDGRVGIRALGSPHLDHGDQ